MSFRRFTMDEALAEAGKSSPGAYDSRAFHDSADGRCSLWLATLARDVRVTEPRVRYIGLMVGATAYWPTKFVRVESRTIARAVQCTEADVSSAVDTLVGLGYAERHGRSQDGRTELRLIVPRIARYRRGSR
ncbi:hypothetical protein [Nakamurella leprariae]|uniref:Uncharacterized protein n=1 Tax=Nakamurella leprariae TaxID=2803911 RepID=A0A939BZ04_9ACTN|nr:hypothetical protein [Nakamurella leprariae]MBM9467171.1 hypothetical protein [Nakamurella leprariae]